MKKVCVLGAGTMGAGIAAHIVGAGIPVCLLDIAPKKLTEKEKAKGLTLDSFGVRNRFAIAGKERVTDPKNKSIYDKTLGDMIEVGNFADNMDMLTECDWIIEVIVEDLEVKKNFMKQINEYRKKGSIVSSNTSGVSIDKIVEDMPLEFKQYFLGTHFFNPPRYMKLFELIPGKDTLPEIVQFMADFATERLGKGIVLAKDTPNFVANRIGTYALENVIQLMDKHGYDIPKLDQLTGPIIGRPKSATFRTIDMVGLDIFYHVVGNVINNIDDEEEKKQLIIPKFVEELIEKGYLGDKTKQGFYKKVKTENGAHTLVWDVKKEDYVPVIKDKVEAIEKAMQEDNKLKALVFGETEENKFAWELIKNVLLYSARKVPEIADDYREIDNAMMWGFNWEFGPFAIWDTIGFQESIKRMKQEGDNIPKWIQERLDNGKFKFYDSNKFDIPYILISSPKNLVVKENKGAALVDIGEEVACLQFKTKGNTITDDVIEMINLAVEEVEESYKGLVIGNQSKNFSSGANLADIEKWISNKEWKSIENMCDAFQKANMALKYCSKPVVAAPYGMTLGGGAEITMHTYKIAAHAETYMGLVELGVGLIPAGGGTKELLTRSIQEAGNASIGEILSSLRKAWNTIVMKKVSGSAHDAMKKGYIKNSDLIVMNKDYLIDEAKKMVIYLADIGFRPLQKKGITVLGVTGRAALESDAYSLLKGEFITEYDAHIANKVAYVLTGGNVSKGVILTEEQILELEKEAFLSLCGEEKTKQRIQYMLCNGKQLRN
ncbi:putative 3-hydroxyacyl-CoA dehydrogenase [Clostridium homopropionicum DSM 5847]|uniref:Putative 3-hydroxyacyl-CoA dehydrogenase n=1 Tax=Clostridium homopropionicum DSM 5847 TaxID=1121318 RepID=A0A0L6Z6N0_9CLOT|nr:3-hydroxyacyl-CoA dehydrogenase/enoyl-CoA hydratase family protein [Clostridium homopropionicum]KOA18615.1 putative 3-hydroxyacyl-CoA dehydrogenase [Clostridium homopropionicum DSM 5847]SFG50136.1 3-hydroxyacyl-CoA dehydrogenase [Clostridium homopropionicum]